jgi:hypothetical protein
MATVKQAMLPGVACFLLCSAARAAEPRPTDSRAGSSATASFASEEAGSAPEPGSQRSFGAYRREVKPEQQQAASLPRSPRRNVRFLGRVTWGGGLALDHVRAAPQDSAGYELSTDGNEGHLAGAAVATEVLLGVLLDDQWGFSIGAHTLPVPRFRASRDGPLRYVFRTSQLAVFGPAVTYYPWPTRGLYGQLELGLASAVMGAGVTSYRDVRPAEAHLAYGLGAVLGGGYELPLGERVHWSSGARITWAGATGVDREDTRWTHGLWGFALLTGLAWR